MSKATFLILLFTFAIRNCTSTSCTVSNDTYIIILGDYTSTNHAQMNLYQPPTNPRVHFLNLTSWTWEISNQTLPSLQGNDASPWFYFGQELASTIKTNNNIYISVLAFDSAGVNDFSRINNTKAKWSLLNKTISLIPQNISVDVLWMVGENDADYSNNYMPCYYLSHNCYSEGLTNLINWSPQCYSWGISLTSYSPYHTVSYQDFIRKEQAKVVTSFNNPERVWIGPDTDQLCRKNRYDDRYFNINGTNILVNQWLQMRNNKSNIVTPSDFYCDYYIFNMNRITFIIILLFTVIISVGVMIFCLSLLQKCVANRHQNTVYTPLKKNNYIYIDAD
jgi:hypothetical protein